jgi:RNA polymerase sigma-70 factor (ECF subfamily)
MSIFASVLRIALAAVSRSQLKTLEDIKLVELFNDGEALAFEELFERYEKRIFYFILRSVKDRERAEELAQDVFLRVIDSIDSFQQTASFKSWLFTIARNICIDHARRQKHRKTRSLQEHVSQAADDDREWLELVVDIEAASGNSEVARAEFRSSLEQALAELPDEQRRTFLLRESEGLKYREIAEIEDVSENTVKSRMRYALQTLQAHLSDYEGFSFDAAEREEVAPNASQKQV